MSQIENISYSGIPLQLSRDCIIASVQIDLTDDVVRQFRKKLLELIRESGAKAVILDLSGLEIMDTHFDCLHLETVTLDKTPFQVMSHSFEVKVLLKIKDRAQQSTLKGGLYYQTCDNFKCYFPRELPIDIPLN